MSRLSFLTAGLAALLPPAMACADPLPPRGPAIPPPPRAIAGVGKLVLVTADAVEPVGLVHAPGDPQKRLFVVERRGRVRILRDGKLGKAPFLDLSARVSTGHPEQGLLGLAFHPRFAQNGRFVVNLTDTEGDTRVLELRVDKTGERADPGTERAILFVDQPFRNHNGGHVVFGPDGKLYVGLGDGGAADDPKGNGQNRAALLGKMLRIDVDVEKPAPEIIQMGLRNPWRYSFDRKTGDLFIADVGQNTYEWVSVARAGKLSGLNFGWNVLEGNHCFKGRPCNPSQFTLPVVEYTHAEGCSITGGFVYRGKALPELDGIYFYADFCTALLRGFRLRDGRAEDSWDFRAALDPDFKLARIASFGEDESGELYVVSHDGPIYKLVRR